MPCKFLANSIILARKQDKLGFPLISFYFLLRRVDCSKSRAINFRMIIKILKMAMRMMMIIPKKIMIKDDGLKMMGLDIWIIHFVLLMIWRLILNPSILSVCR